MNFGPPLPLVTRSLQTLVGEHIELEVSAGSLDDGWEPLLIVAGNLSLTAIGGAAGGGPFSSGRIEMLIGDNPAYLDLRALLGATWDRDGDGDPMLTLMTGRTAMRFTRVDPGQR